MVCCVLVAYVDQAWMAADGVHIVAHGVLKDHDNTSTLSHRHGVVTVIDCRFKPRSHRTNSTEPQLFRRFKNYFIPH